ncbi:TTL-domain-containing protein [Meira miltonrushii]|uniref:TTL-domain-containing protein n=1 Tax=Meira miltonrushii TaxID=1280837 RepID=A0A316V3R2_9BASI|nr:TTL-domain-containing protein [Meira miltonrushii]PWN32170.1 TTL-domain-containing protein [Meira miltonrushii]
MRSVWVGFPTAPYTHQSAVNAAEKVLEPAGWTIHRIDPTQDFRLEEVKLPKADVYFGDYDLLPFEDVHPKSGTQSDTSGGEAVPYPQLSSYVIRKSLIRKNYLAHSLHLAKVKNQPSTSQNDDIAPATWIFEATCAEDLDELLADDLYDVKEILESDQNRWFILKPAMADQGMGIRLFNSIESLEAIFEEFEEESDEEEDEETNVAQNSSSTAVVISQVRQFVIQEYLQNPLVIQAPTLENYHKFHIRAYVLAQGSLRVFLYDEMLALFAPKAYSDPEQNDDEEIDLSAHLTNTSRQDDEQSLKTVHLLSDLEGSKIGPGATSTVLTSEHLNAIRLGSAATIAEAFEACTKAGRIHFQPWPNAWEIFGVDLMVTVPNASPTQSISPNDLRVWLLEINAQPDFAKSGPKLQEKIDRLFERSLEIAVLGQDGEDENAEKKWQAGSSRKDMTLCLDIPMSSGGW